MSEDRKEHSFRSFFIARNFIKLIPIIHFLSLTSTSRYKCKVNMRGGLGDRCYRTSWSEMDNCLYSVFLWKRSENFRKTKKLSPLKLLLFSKRLD